jgi:hypothetical protein
MIRVIRVIRVEWLLSEIALHSPPTLAIFPPARSDPPTARTRFMPRTLSGRSAALLLVFLTGCGIVGPRRDSTARGPKPKAPSNEMAAGPKATREPPLADPSSMIPQPPNMDDLVPAIPGAPPKEQLVAAVTEPDGFVPAAGVVAPRRPVERARAVADDRVTPAAAAEAVQETNPAAVRRIAKRAADKYQALAGFECRLTRREMVNGRPMPQEELQYKFRRDPYSVHIKWVGLEGQGRELIYVDGKFDNKVQILTGKGEGLIVPSGMRVARLPGDKDVRSKSRHDIREPGMGMAVEWFGKVAALMEKDPTQAKRMKYLGVVKGRPERAGGLEGVEETIPPGWEPLLPKGGKRTTYFDPDPASPSFGLPVLISAFNEGGREVEYYSFDQLRPTTPTDADFDPDRLWKK